MAQPQSALLSLPAELRERIYSFCLHEEELSMLGTPPKPPSLLYVCRKVRAEAIPVYSSKLTLRFSTYIKRGIDGRTWSSTKSWHRSIPYEVLRHVKRYKLKFGLVQRRTKELVPIDFVINLNKRQNEFILNLAGNPGPDVMRSFPGSASYVDFGAAASVLRGHLETVLQDIVGDPGIGNFGADDVDRLIKIDPDALGLHTSA